VFAGIKSAEMLDDVELVVWLDEVRLDEERVGRRKRERRESWEGRSRRTTWLTQLAIALVPF